MISISIGKADVECTDRVVLTSGMVKAVEVAFSFSNKWDGFSKIAIFSNGTTTVDVSLDEDDKCYIPHEVLEVAGEEVTVGVYGHKGEGDDYVAIPTETQSLGEVVEGANPSGEEPAEPTPTVWEELKIRVENTYTKEEVNAMLSLAKREMLPTSLVGITTSNTNMISITDNQISCGVGNTTLIDVHGEVEFEFNGSTQVDFYVDDKKLGGFEPSTTSYVGETKYIGYVESGIKFVFHSGGTIDITKFNVASYTGGTLTPELAEKVIRTQVFTQEEKSKLANIPVVGDAGYTFKDITFTQLQNEGKLTVSEGAVVQDKEITNSTYVKFAFDSYVDIERLVVRKGQVYINGKLYEDYTNATSGWLSYNGYVETLEIIGDTEYLTVYFNKLITNGRFKVAEYNGGHITSEQLKRIGNTYTITEVNNLITEAFGNVAQVFDEVHEYAESLGGDEA